MSFLPLKIDPFARNRRGLTVGDTVAENFTRDEDIHQWHANEAGDHIATEEEMQAHRERWGMSY